MSNKIDEIKAELMKPIGPPEPGEATWYRNSEGTYTVAAFVVGIICVAVTVYAIH